MTQTNLVNEGVSAVEILVPGLQGPEGASGGSTNLGYVPTTRTVTSDTGTGAVLTLADGTNAGLLTAADFTKLSSIAAGAEANVQPDWNAVSGDGLILNKPALGSAAGLNVGTGAGSVVQLDGSGRLPAVDGSQLTNLPGGGGGATDLSYTAGTRLLESSTGADVTLPLASGSAAGLMAAADFSKLLGIAAGAEVNVRSDWNAGSGDALILNKPALGNAAGLDVGTTAGTVAAGDDARLSNARTPTAHASTHATGQPDALTPADIGAVSLMSDGFPPDIWEVEPVKWMWLNTGENGVSVPTGLTTESSGYDEATKTITAVTNTAIPAPISANSGGVPDGSAPLGSASNLGDGIQVGDRVFWGDQSFWGGVGITGVYVVTDLGEDGVRPYVLTRAPELSEPVARSRQYRVKLATNNVSELLNAGWEVVVKLPSVSGWNYYSVARSGSANLWGEALGRWSSALTGARALGEESHAIGTFGFKVQDSYVVGIYGANGAFIRRRVNNRNGSFTFERIDEARVTRSTAVAAITATIPTSAAVGSWFSDAQLEVLQAGDGAVTIVGDAGVTVTGNTSTAGIGSRLLAVHLGSDAWEVTCIPGGLGTAAAQDVGVGAGDVVQLDGSSRLPAVDGSQLTNLPSGASSLDGLTDVAITGPQNDQVLKYSGGTWINAAAPGGGGGTVTSVGIVAPTGLTVSGSPVTTSGNITLAYSAGYEGFLSADKTKLDGIETGADVTDTANVTAAGALMDSEVTNLAQVKAFNSADYATAAQGALADSATQPGDLPAFPSGAVVGTTDAQTLTNKTLGDITEGTTTIVDGAAVVLDPRNVTDGGYGAMAAWNIGANNRTATLANFTAGTSLTVSLTVTTGSLTVTGADWGDAGAPTLVNGENDLLFYSTDGVTVKAVAGWKNTA